VNKHHEAELRAFVASELNMTLKMIKANTSNFSAWHYRSKLIPIFFNQEQINWRSDDAFSFFQSDLEYLKHAIYTDPKDQSPWNYHYWVINSLIPVHLIDYEWEAKDGKLIITLTFSDKICFKSLAQIEGIDNYEIKTNERLSTIVTLIFPLEMKEAIISPKCYDKTSVEQSCFSSVNTCFDKIMISKVENDKLYLTVDNKMIKQEETLLESQLEVIEDLILLNDDAFYEHALLRKVEILQLLYYRNCIDDKSSSKGQEYKLLIKEVLESLSKSSKRMKLMYRDMLSNFQ
jgi:hypothetical protein